MKLILCIILGALTTAAQTQPWTAVQGLSAGTDIRLTGLGQAAVRGTLKSVTGDSLVLNSAAGDTTFTRQSVTRLSVKKQSHRARNTLIGIGAGAAGGLIIGSASDSKCSPDCFISNNLGKAILTPFGTLVGGLIGLIWPTGGWKEIYKA